MAEPSAREQGAPVAGAAERIGRDVGLLAGRLAQLLAKAPVARQSDLADGHAFLAAMGEAAAGAPARALEGSHPLDRLGLTPVEGDVLLLAGMPEEHEGYASVLRMLHPRGEPRATVGLAAQLLCRTVTERRLLRGLLELGQAVRGGALQLGGDGPFFERSLLLGEGVWAVLNGIDVWPAGLHVISGPIATAGLE